MIAKNVISGLLLFGLSILIGPYMMGSLKTELLAPALTAQFTQARALQGALGEYEGADIGDAKSVAADALAGEAGKAVIANIKMKQAEDRFDNFKFSHAHGNLQGILNILMGLMLAQLAISVKFREVLSWLFILGSWGHAGFFILGNFLVAENPKLGFFFLVNAKFGGGLLILGLWLTLIAVVLHLRAKKKA